MQENIEILKEMVINARWDSARTLADTLYQAGESSEDFWILNASIYEYEGREKEYYACICLGLHQWPLHYELYYMLGNYYFNKNINQAYLCFENALFYCKNEEDVSLIQKSLKEVRNMKGFSVRNFSVVLLSYNIKDIMIDCVESIRRNNLKETYEIVVVDNASSDGITEWLRMQNDIVLKCNKENAGFALGCNQGIEMANEQNDILLLNNDTIVLPNSLFWLRMGLYERESVGAVGPLTNFAPNGQELIQRFETKEAYIENAKQINVPIPNSYENKMWLVGFAMFISRVALNDIGMLDTRYEWGNSEDTDYGLMLGMAGYENLLCYNSFIYHYGSLNMAKDKKKYMDYLNKNTKILVEKWKFEVPYYTKIRSEYIDSLRANVTDNKNISILEIGCGCGATLARIKHLYPKARVYGIEKNPVLAKFAKVMGIIIIEDVSELGGKQSFDYIFKAEDAKYLENT